jgi:hypothetical protein
MDADEFLPEGLPHRHLRGELLRAGSLDEVLVEPQVRKIEGIVRRFGRVDGLVVDQFRHGRTFFV